MDTLGGDAAKSGVQVHKMTAQSLGTVTTTARAVVAKIKRSSSQRGWTARARSCPCLWSVAMPAPGRTAAKSEGV